MNLDRENMIKFYLPSQQTMNNSDDNSRYDTGNDLETQACTRTSDTSQRHVARNHQRSIQV